MKKLFHTRLSILILLAFFVGCFLLFQNLWGRSALPYDFQRFEEDGKENLIPGEPLMQLFTATHDHLSQLNILMKNLDSIEPEDTFTITLRDEKCGETIRTLKHHLPAHAPNQYDNWIFEPIKDSAEKTYCLHVLYEAPEKRDTRPAIYKEKETGNPKDVFILLKGDEIKSYSQEKLIFHPAYRMSFSNTYNEINRRISAYKADFVSGDMLTAVFIGFFGFTILLVTLLVLTPLNSTQENKRSSQTNQKKTPTQEKITDTQPPMLTYVHQKNLTQKKRMPRKRLDL